VSEFQWAIKTKHEVMRAEYAGRRARSLGAHPEPFRRLWLACGHVILSPGERRPVVGQVVSCPTCCAIARET
jgi:hypothetical protein